MVGGFSPSKWGISRIDHVATVNEDVKNGISGFDPDVDRHIAIPTASIQTAKPGDQPEPVAPRAFKASGVVFFHVS